MLKQKGVCRLNYLSATLFIRCKEILIILFLGCEQEPLDNILVNADEALVNDLEFPTLNYVTDLDIPDVMGGLTARVPA